MAICRNEKRVNNLLTVLSSQHEDPVHTKQHQHKIKGNGSPKAKEKEEFVHYKGLVFALTRESMLTYAFILLVLEICRKAYKRTHKILRLLIDLGS